MDPITIKYWKVIKIIPASVYQLHAIKLKSDEILCLEN